MTTPIFDFVNKYTESEALRLHMPGHKGQGVLGFEKFDITEINGADVLYNSNGIINESQRNAASLFGTEKTLYSVEGSSLAIRAMVYLTRIYASLNGKKPVILAGRNAHKTFITVCGILNVDVNWLLPPEEKSLISCKISPEFLDKNLTFAKEKPVAVYVTTPDYLGNMTDISALSKVCLKHGVLLLVDNAHGAYLNFLPDNCHPITQGAHLCCDSAHKTLPVLTGGAYLHISKTAPEIIKNSACNAMSLFASTSPSYLILESLDLVNKYLSDGYAQRLSDFIKSINLLKEDLRRHGYTLEGDEPLKLTIAAKFFGYTGFELAELIEKENVFCEFADPDFIVFMLTLENENKGLERLKAVLLGINKKEAKFQSAPELCERVKRKTISEAVFSPSVEIEVEKAIGQVLAAPTVSCPPAIPIVVCGEEIDRNAVECFKYYGIKKCSVVKNTHYII